MGRAPRSQRRRFGLGEVLVPPQAQPVQPLVECLESLRSTWRREGSLAALWQDWPQLAGRPLADHCKPLNLSHGVLTVGARHPQWRQALQYSKPQLLAAVRSAGHAVRDLRIQQHHPSPTADLDTEESVWARHPSRIDVHGMASCPCSCWRDGTLGPLRVLSKTEALRAEWFVLGRDRSVAQKRSGRGVFHVSVTPSV